MDSDLVVTVLTFDADTLGARLAGLAWPAPAAFAAACAQRLFTGYERYVNESGEGDTEKLRAALSALWESFSGTGETPDFGRWAEDCEALVPDLLTEWTVAGQYAEDAVTAAVYAVRCAQTRDPGLAVVSAQRAYESVDAILLYELDFDYSRSSEEQRMLAHPLTQSEFQRQERDLAELAAASTEDLRTTARHLRELAEAEPVH
jgi:uncharacterized protein YjaG (DUF416 family)